MSVLAANSMYGVSFISVVVAAILNGVSLIQTLYYYANQNDSWPIKLTVAVVVSLDVAHQAFISHSTYRYSITDWGNPGDFQYLIWSLSAQVMLIGLMAFIVQCFFTLRVWRLSVRNIYLTCSPAILVVGSLVLHIVFVVETVQVDNVFTGLKWISISINALEFAADFLITAILFILLKFSRSGFQKSDAIINKLIICTVNTGLLTSLCALGSLISILLEGETFIYVLFFFCIGRLYTISLLTTLNARKLLRSISEGGGNRTGDRTLSLRNLPSSPISSQRPNISIKIDTIQELHGEKIHENFGEESD